MNVLILQEWYCIIITALSATAPLLLPSQIAVIAYITARQLPSIYEDEDENLFLNDKKSVPSLHDPATRELSVVIPSYNEEERCKNKYLYITYFAL